MCLLYFVAAASKNSRGTDASRRRPTTRPLRCARELNAFALADNNRENQ